jgi:hypothetical protein
MVTAVQATSLESRAYVSVDVQVIEAKVLPTEVFDNRHNRWVVHDVAENLLVQHGLHVTRLHRLR